MKGIIKIETIPETCNDCFLHSYAIGCRCRKKKYEGYKTTRPEWCPIERTTYHRQSLEVDKKEEFYE